eukprot:TRINITY_DN24440_c0_g3_i1.p1 TRINITY_DN24440_c0_g3~~TRINITY_DN24440_c0_g3_i1.p1  ORF type:complete len:675 (+),score=154.92 TRINITY_DN24440_c0_g3_i1:101-2125(+)
MSDAGRRCGEGGAPPSAPAAAVAAAAVLSYYSAAFASASSEPEQLKSSSAPSKLRQQSSSSRLASVSEHGMLGLTSGAVVSGSALAAAASIGGRRRRGQAARLRAKLQEKQAEQSKASMSQALPFVAVPGHLTNIPTNTKYPGDLGFDPLALGADEYVSDVIRNFGFEFDALRWYRESELMHGRVAMLAVFKVILDASFPGVAPVENSSSMWEFVQIMAMLEAFRGYRLLFNQDAIAGDLGIAGQKQGDNMLLQELAEKQYKELQNGRLAMLAFAGMATQYEVTGRAVGFDLDAALLGTATQTPTIETIGTDIALTIAGVGMAVDGIRRLSGQENSANSIASKAINLMKLQSGVQEPQVSLPAGVVAGQAPVKYEISAEQVVSFEEDGVIMIKGAMKDWVPFLQAVTDDQIDNPHIWSLVGRMSGMYDYIQRNMWMTNNGFRDFLYYSPLGHIVSQLARTEEVRCSTDMLLVNPNRGFGWHQDNQNGPIDFPDAIRWWVAMDRCGQNDFGAPEYLLGSHRNTSVSSDAVFVNLEDGDLGSFPRKTKFIPEPGDLIIWNARTIHRIVAPPDQKWDEGTQRRAIGGTMARAGAIYRNKGGASGISDLAGHTQKNGEALGGPYFPRIFPDRLPEEQAVRDQKEIVGRSPRKMLDLGITLMSNASKYVSFTKVIGKKD